ncbi:DNA mismatch repair endonuclease MutL [Gallibacter intestinalis]|uniref:DNA mismatch repair protein MutL n=1 Tax=Gallibacter intestinalis TaxID=2779356 RepID=A0ABR9QVU5_9FIRM|nr:DNA mismatch repair endonuclease MutL [Gallibacter intestinalis]MBE5034994.1 DNA mismatch repair endonuclease MutL [Gallibacter intestinalis]
MIRILDKSTADKIAAGEVVERPLSVVKELVENSIDAGAKKIAVEIKNGGKSYIRVTDDGCGIAADECEKAFMRHATSKIINAEDLNSISTLGFRGEALASIAAISRTELLTKTKESKTGSKLIIEGGQIIENTPVGCPDGTTMVIRDLFFNTPARLKFMRADSAESSSVIEFVTDIALAYPDIRIQMINNDKILFATNGRGNRGQTIATLTSSILADKLIPFIYEEEGITVEGYVSGPGESRSSRKNQVFFVNGRVIDSKVIEKGINRAYSDRLFEGRFPICYLFITVSPERMDVNIHPNKRQVRFYDEDAIINTVRKGIITALDSEEAVPTIKEKAKPYNKIENKNDNPKEVRDAVDINSLLSNYEQTKESNKTIFEQNTVETPKEKEIVETQEQIKIAVQDEISKPIFTVTEPKRFDFSSLQIHGQFFGTYIQLSDEETIYFIDQHAAHERIFFEKLMNQFQSREKHRQPLLIPITFEVSHADKEREDLWLTVLEDMGFSLDEFGPLSYRVSEIPMFMSMSEAEDFLSDFTDGIGTYEDIRDNKTLDKIATRACKAAVKANDYLSKEEIKQLITDLDKCNNPFSCPHGRPTFIKITKSDLEKRFKRI